MLANPLDDGEIGSFDIAPYRAEWKWDGIRVQLAARGGERRLYSRTGDDISAAFPDICDAMDFDAVLDGELLVAHPVDPAQAGADGGAGGIVTGAPAVAVASFNQLQQRLKPQDRLGEDAEAVPGLGPALRHPLCRRGGRARPRFRPAPGAAGGLVRRHPAGAHGPV